MATPVTPGFDIGSWPSGPGRDNVKLSVLIRAWQNGEITLAQVLGSAPNVGFTEKEVLSVIHNYDMTAAQRAEFVQASVYYERGAGAQPTPGQGEPSQFQTAGPYTSTTPGQSPYAVAEEYDPYTAYLNALGLGTKTFLTPAERYQRSLFKPTEALYRPAQQVARETGQYIPETTEDYALWMAGLAGKPEGLRGTARSTLQSILGFTPAQRTLREVGYEPQWEERAMLEPATWRRGELQNLLQEAYRGAGGYGTWLARRVPEEEQRYASLKAAGQQVDPFIEYLTKRYNIRF